MYFTGHLLFCRSTHLVFFVVVCSNVFLVVKKQKKNEKSFIHIVYACEVLFCLLLCLKKPQIMCVCDEDASLKY